MSKCLGRDISVRQPVKVSIELSATFRHRLNMTERLLKARLSPNQTNCFFSPFHWEMTQNDSKS